MPRSRQEAFELMAEAEKASKCIRFLRFFWKIFRCVFSHVSLISLVVLYCVIGAYAFEALEANHEKEIKRNIKNIRGNVAEQLWKITKEVEVLIRENWTEKALRELKSFEGNLVWMMEKEGWNGSEGEDDIQWTFAGALFYSIVVITTIGYGHIAPKTKNGKVVTIFYAILGIPLMLLCLSNIGDIMASSFRFLYWRVCCYICTKPPAKRRRTRAHFGRSYSVRQPGRYGASRGGTFRRSVRMSERSADSALGLSECMTRSSFSDMEYKYNVRRYEDNEQRGGNSYPSSVNRNLEFKSATVSRYSDLPMSSAKTMRASPKMTTQSLDRRLLMRPLPDTDRSAVFCNKYALNEFENEARQWQTSVGKKTREENKAKDTGATETTDNPENNLKQAPLTTRSLPRRCLSMEGATMNYKTNLTPSLRPSSIYLNMENGRRGHQSIRTRRYRSNYPVARSYRRESLAPDMIPAIPAYTGHRQIYPDEFDSDYEYYIEDQERQPIKPVPIWLCVFLVVSYIFGGAFLFSAWEHWPFLDSAYFCFITLTTIGFGDFVPAYKLDAHKGIAVCSLYLLFGIALLAMSFNLVQEEVINNVKNVAKRLGIIKESDDEEEAEDLDAYEVEYNDEVDDEELEGYVLDSPRCHSMPRNSSGISRSVA